MAGFVWVEERYFQTSSVIAHLCKEVDLPGVLGGWVL